MLVRVSEHKQGLFSVHVIAVCFGFKTVGVPLSTTTRSQPRVPEDPNTKSSSGSHERTAHAARRWIVLLSIVKLYTMLLQINP